MASALKNLSTYDASTIPDASKKKFGIVVAEWNAEITHALYQGCVETLLAHGAQEDQIFTVQVPGTYELPAAASLLIKQTKPDAVVCIGCVIKGDTSHNEYINHSVALALQQLSIGSSIPCIFGVLTPNTWEQAKERAGGVHGNKGVEAAVTALRMSVIKDTLNSIQGKKSIGFNQ